MKKFASTSLALAVVIVAGIGNAARTNDCEEALDRFNRVVNTLTAQLLYSLYEPCTTVTVGGACIAFISGVFEEYTKKQTEAQIMRFLNVTKDEFRCIATSVNKDVVAIQEDDPTAFVPVASFYANKNNYTFTRQFVKDVQNILFGEAKVKDFNNNPEKTADDINQYNSDKTNGEISIVISSDDINNCTQLISTDAVLKQAAFKYRFKESDSTMDTFYITPCKAVTTLFLNQVQTYYYVDNPTIQAQIVKIPYRSSIYSIYVILPYSICGVQKVLQQFIRNPKLFPSIQQSLVKTDLTFSWPFINASTLWSPKEIIEKLNYITRLDCQDTSDIVNVVKNDKPIALSITRQRATLISTYRGGNPPKGPDPAKTTLFKANRPFITFNVIRDQIVTGLVFGNPQEQINLLVDAEE